MPRHLPSTVEALNFFRKELAKLPPEELAEMEAEMMEEMKRARRAQENRHGR
jgi:hypothetical protein